MKPISDPIKTIIEKLYLQELRQARYQLACVVQGSLANDDKVMFQLLTQLIKAIDSRVGTV